MERLTREGLVDGLDVDTNPPLLGQCEACIKEAKMTTKFSAVTTDEYIAQENIKLNSTVRQVLEPRVATTEGN
jgi:hypothetical protein